MCGLPVSADESGYMSNFKYVAYDSYGLIYLSEEPLFFAPAANIKSETSSNYYIPYYGVGFSSSSSFSSFYVLIPSTDSSYLVTKHQNLTLTYDPSNISSPIVDTYSSSGNYFYLHGSSNTYYSLFKFLITIGRYSNFIDKPYSITANYSPVLQMSGYPDLPFSDVTVDSDLTLSDVVSDGIDVDSLLSGIQSAIDSGIDQIISVGSDYVKFIPVDAATALDKTVTNLSTAEGAVSNQSSSLADSVSDEWSSYKDQAKALVTTVKPSAVVFTTTFATVVDAFPDEVKALLVAVPLIIFIGWLIGRVKG